MDNFNWESFTKKIAVKADISKIYNAWTIASEIEKWFLSNAVFENTAGQQLPKDKNFEKNNRYYWSWYLYDVLESGKIVEANGKDLIQFTFAGDCLVTIKLTQAQDYVIVELTQSNIPTDNQSKRGIRLGCDSGWSFFLLNLKAVYESGIDLRNKNTDLKGMVNN